MTDGEISTLCESKEEWTRLYRLFDDCIANFLDSSKLNHSEHSFDILKAISTQVINDIGESWHRRSLSK